MTDYAPTSFFAGFHSADAARLRTHNLLLLALPESGPHNRAALRQVLALRKKTIVFLFDSTALATLPELRQATAVVLVKARSIAAVNHAVQVVFGGMGATGARWARPSSKMPRGRACATSPLAMRCRPAGWAAAAPF